ncbi:LysM peptidoglycan-binding domain-containing protein [Cohnella panacarvi]|uniref:LysM peptidoglycan-binding domain-containing protein n=1 Tax=Cohnella panacarvi TaxID=400776 RepID=UPI0004790BD6|nr:LysM domain-containing protein [Cohnella panacarvi]
MDRGFFPGGGFGPGFGGGFGRPFFRPFPSPFFPNRFLFPTFFFSPFFFPFFRAEQGGGEASLFAQHQVQPGETLASIGHAYNMPHAIIEETNPHLNPQQLKPGETVHIPRISNMMCHKTYAEMPANAQHVQPMA